MPLAPHAADLQPIAEFRQLAPAASAATQPLLVPAPAAAKGDLSRGVDRPSSAPYVSLAVGGAFPNIPNGTIETGPPLGSIGNQLAFNPGFAGELAAGYKFANARLELAAGYGTFKQNQQTVTILGQSIAIPATGQMSYLSAMLNGYYDFSIRQQDGRYSRWYPYIGAGIGYASASTPSCPFGTDCFAGGSAGTFAYQGKVGVTYRASKMSDVFVEVAYLGTTGFTVNTVSYDNIGAYRVTVGWRQRL